MYFDELSARSRNQQLVVKSVGDEFDRLTERMPISFNQELSLMQRFRDHDNFAKVYGYCLAPACLIMKLYALGDLSGFISGKGEVSRDFAYSKLIMIDFIRQYCVGIQYMHNNGFAHCDIKPANVLLDMDIQGQLMSIVTDFGITRIIDKSVESQWIPIFSIERCFTCICCAWSLDAI